MTRTVSSRERAGRAAIIVVSVIGHGLALAVLGLSAPVLREVRRIDPRAFELELWQPPRDTLAARPGAVAAARPSPVAPRRAAILTPPASVETLPATPVVSKPAAAGPGAPAAGSTGVGADGLRQALRGSTVGCANRDAVGLTRREREACDEALGRPRDQAAIIDTPMDPAKRAAWDAVAARKALSRRRKEGPVPPGLPPNDNAGGTRTNGLGILGY